MVLAFVSCSSQKDDRTTSFFSEAEQKNLWTFSFDFLIVSRLKDYFLHLKLSWTIYGPLELVFMGHSNLNRGFGGGVFFSTYLLLK